MHALPARGVPGPHPTLLAYVKPACGRHAVHWCGVRKMCEQALWATDPTGFYLGMYRGEIIGAAAAIVVDPTFASSALLTIKPEYRRLNCGALLYGATFRALNQVSDRRCRPGEPVRLSAAHEPVPHNLLRHKSRAGVPRMGGQVALNGGTVVGASVPSNTAYYEAVGARRSHGAVRIIVEGPGTSYSTWKDQPQVRLPQLGSVVTRHSLRLGRGCALLCFHRISE